MLYVLTAEESKANIIKEIRQLIEDARLMPREMAKTNEGMEVIYNLPISEKVIKRLGDFMEMLERYTVTDKGSA
jgi:hypothetical protein